ncbi:MAG: hypothetical protein U9R19_04595 [Bacteroidota bacterium]|nr:hypothetical protein [Bacteroidota bacterium]
MKKKIISTRTFLLIGILVLGTMISCEDKDTTAPKAELAGPNPYKITLNQPYIEYGFDFIYDNRDDSASLKIEIEHEIDTLEGDYLNIDNHNVFVGEGATIQTGDFVVTYTITDKAGNITVLIRDVIITNSLNKFTREYDVVKDNVNNIDDIYEDYTNELEASEELNNRLYIPGFSDFDDASLSVYSDIRGDSIFIPLQSFPPPGVPNNYVIEGDIDADNNGYAGTVSHTNYRIEITYKAGNNSHGVRIFHEVFTKL